MIDDDGSYIVKACLPAEIGALFVKALDAAGEEISTPNVPARERRTGMPHRPKRKLVAAAAWAPEATALACDQQC